MRITTFILALFLVTNSLTANTFPNVTANPVMPTLSNLSVCDDNNDGIAVFDLTVQNPIILAAQASASSNYTINYYLTQTDAITGFNAISSPNSFVNMNNQQVIYVRITLNGSTQFAIGTFDLIVNPLVIPIFTTISSLCQGSIAPVLPTTSINFPITGTWSPSTVDTSVAGATVFTFTPFAGQCATTTTMVVNVEPATTLTLISPPQTTNQTLCNNSPISNIVYDFGGSASGATVTGLPTGITATVNGSSLTIYGVVSTGFPTVYHYTVITTGGCNSQSLTGTITIATPTINTPADFATCDNDGGNDGYHSYDLSALIPSILGSQSASNFTVAFYDNQMSAVNNVNVIANLVSYQTYTHSIWIRVTNNASGCYAISSFNTTIEQAPTPVITSNSNVICVDFVTNNVIRNATLTASDATGYMSQTFPTYTYQWYLNGTPIAGATSATYTVNSPFPDSLGGNFSVRMTSISALGCSNYSQDFQVNQSGPASLNPTGSIGYSIVNNAGNQTITVEVQGYGTYEYSIDSGTQQTSPIFQNVALGTHSITIWDTKGGISNSCDPIVISNINVNLTATPPPTGSNSQSFNPGTTLASIQVTGQNIKWYSGLNKNVTSTPLPLSTILVDGTTYYASQTIGGYESTTRLPVTVHLALNTEQFELKELTYAPNPVATNLSIQSDDVIDSYSIYNLLGQVVASKKCYATTLQIDVTSLNAGNYFVKLTSENKQSTIKIEKR